MSPRLKLKSRWATENNNHRSRDTGSGQDACLARSTNAPSNSALCNCVALEIAPGKELAVHGPPNPPGPSYQALSRQFQTGSITSELAGSQPRPDPSSQNQQLGKVLPLLSPAPDGRSAPCSPHRHVRATRRSRRNCRGRGAIDSGERQGRQSKADIPAGPHACGGREPFGTGKVRRHDLPRRPPPLSRTWLITFWTPAMFRACVVTLSSSGRLPAMPIRYTIPFTVSTV